VEDEHSRGPLVLARVNDALVVAFSPDVIAEVRKMAEARRKTPTSQRASTALMSRLQRLGVKPQQRLTGIIGLDLINAALVLAHLASRHSQATV
jgi:hypothetical protein